MADVFLHIGMPKTGTTTIQAALDQHAAALGGQGVLYPGGSHNEQRLAVYDFLGHRTRGDERTFAGAFARLRDEVAAYDGRAAIVSDEGLSVSRPRQVRRLCRALAPHCVHVVVGVRDLGRTLVSAWQQSVVMGATATWQEFVDEIREPGTGLASAGLGFELRHDLVRVLDVWGAEVPPERIRLVTVPAPGAPGHVLLDRFCAAVDLPDGLLTEVRNRYVSLGAAELEVLRRLNGVLDEDLNPRQRLFVVDNGLRPRWGVEESRRLTLPTAEYAWVDERARAQVAELERRGYPVYGDLADLRPERPPEGRRLDDVSESELLEAAQGALVALAVGHGKLWTRFRRQTDEGASGPPKAFQAVGSSARASSFRLQKAVLSGADHNRLLARIMRRYATRRG